MDGSLRRYKSHTVCKPVRVSDIVYSHVYFGSNSLLYMYACIHVYVSDMYMHLNALKCVRGSDIQASGVCVCVCMYHCNLMSLMVRMLETEMSN